MKHSFIRITKFLISGISAAAIEYVVFIYLYTATGNKLLLLCQSISFCCGFIVSYSLNRIWVFKSDNDKKNELIKYSVLAVTNLIISNALIWVLISNMGVTFWAAKFIVMALIATWNYIIFQKLIFNSQE